MKTTKQKISLRGSLADEVAKRITSEPDSNLSLILEECLQLNSGDIIQVPQKGIVLIGKKSDLGKYLPDW